jgi:hypothetical protein
MYVCTQGADKSLARPGRKQAWKYVRGACDFKNIKMRAVSKFFPARQGPEGNSHHLTETLACFLPGRAKDLSAPLYVCYIHLLAHCFNIMQCIWYCVTETFTRI